MSAPPQSKRQKKLADAKGRNMTKGQLWRAREKQGRSVNGLKGKKAILVISNRGRERMATDEAIALLELEEDFEEDSNDEGITSLDLQSAVEKELAAIRETKTVRFNMGLPCLTAVSASSDPVAIISQLFNTVIAEGKARSTHIEKLIPFQIVCHPSMEAVVKAVSELLKSTLGADSPPQSFAVMPKIRGGESGELDRAKLITTIADLVDQKRHPVNLTEPDVVIIVEIIRSIAGVSLVSGSDFRKFKRFHLRAITEATEGEE